MPVPPTAFTDLGEALLKRASAREEPASDWIARVGGLSAEDAKAIVDTLAAASNAHGRIRMAAQHGLGASEWLAAELGAIPGLNSTARDDLARALGLPVGRSVFAVASELAGLAGSALGGLGGGVGAGTGGILPGVASFARTWLNSPLGDVSDDELASLAAAFALPIARGAFGDAVSPGAVAAGLQQGASAVKSGFKVATGALRPGDAVQWLGDRAVAAVATLVGQVARENMEHIGSAVGSAIGAFVGFAPVGAMIGAAVGKHVEAFVGAVVAEHVETIGRSFVRTAARQVGRGIALAKHVFGGLGF